MDIAGPSGHSGRRGRSTKNSPKIDGSFKCRRHLPYSLASSLAESDPESGLVVKSSERKFKLAWPAMKALDGAVSSVLDGQMCFFDWKLGGSPLAWGKAAVDPESVQPTGDNRDVHLRANVDYVVFAPAKGSIIKAEVSSINRRGGGRCFIDCLAHGLFNVVCVEEPPKGLALGSTVRVQVTHVTRAKRLIKVHGTLEGCTTNGSKKKKKRKHPLPDLIPEGVDLDAAEAEQSFNRTFDQTALEETLAGQDLDKQLKKDKKKKKKRKHEEVLDDSANLLDKSLDLDAKQEKPDDAVEPPRKRKKKDLIAKVKVEGETEPVIVKQEADLTEDSSTPSKSGKSKKKKKSKV